jgi:hypothetical protein
MTKSRARWLVPLLLTVHNAEEGLFMHRVLPLPPERFPALVRGLVPAMTLPRFLVALAIVTVLPWLVALWGSASAAARRRTCCWPSRRRWRSTCCPTWARR